MRSKSKDLINCDKKSEAMDYKCDLCAGKVVQEVGKMGRSRRIKGGIDEADALELIQLISAVRIRLGSNR